MINFVPKVTGEQTSTEVTYGRWPVRIYSIIGNTVHLAYFGENGNWNCCHTNLDSSPWQEITEPKTRHITADDIMKMLAVNPLVYYARIETPDEWIMMHRPFSWFRDDKWSDYQFSHNPFTANPVIVGPEIGVME